MDRFRPQDLGGLPGPYRERAGPKASTVQEGPYPAGPDGTLTPEGLQEACRHVWRDWNSTVMLGSDIVNSEPVSFDDKNALFALKRHIKRAGPRSFIEDVLPKLGFGPQRQPAAGTMVCTRCGKDAVPLHLGCTLCEDCCDCRPTDAT